ncbi:hypothetical protein [Kutzneria sp. CA-103260]|uniref:hypothetical protein n=1 Tax=Kutzneria sp. CA-103260 TaxID=2802641 RepID=UPI001BA9E614|nr:hypothetical protein [Kutzneria sp. CA-103260]QUQ62739.1 hypothetical protein JJ691_04510 [Kutzneria sp. CA-103260]
MPPTPASVVEQWQSLPRTVLQDKVRQVVKRRDADAKQIWAHVRADSVLAAQVRGALSALRAEVRGTRDEVMWTMWIDQARAVLDASPEKSAPQKVTAEKLAVEKKAAAEKPVADQASEQKPAAEKASAPKASPAKTAPEKPAAAATETPAAEKKPAPVQPAFTAKKSDSEPEPAQQLTYTPPADKPRTAPAVAPVMFQAPGH